MATLSHNSRIESALDDLRSQEKPNYRATAEKYGVSDTTLGRRFKGQQTSREEANSEYRKCLTTANEEELVVTINRLTDRAIPPISAMVRSFAEEVAGRPVGKNWTSDFVKRYKDRLKSLYLRNIDGLRTKAEYAPMFKLFFDMVTFCRNYSAHRVVARAKLLTAYWLINGIHKYNITADNVWNWDEKGSF